jgi:short-subunit dehydrogenase
MPRKKIPDGSLALVTGASSGIGFEISKVLAMEGYNLIIVSNEKKQLGEIKKIFEKDYGIGVTAITMDLAEQGAAIRLHQMCGKKKLVVDILVNNAGMFFFGEAVEASPDKAQSLLGLHVVTHSLMCTLFGRDMKERKRGYILTTGSIAGYRNFPGISYYGASKSYLMSFSSSLRCEMKDYNVSVTCVCPGATATNLYGKPGFDMGLAVKTGIMVTPEKVARAAVRAMFRGKGVFIPGILNKIMVFIACVMPQFVIDFIKRHTDII